jgi:hypothetical protein
MKAGQAASVFFACLLFPFAVSAQDKTESVTVTGQTPQTRTEIMRGFVRSTVAPSPLTGKLARWDNPICPLIIGLKPEENQAVRERIKKDAESVGAPVSADPSCNPNLVVAFALHPQDLMTKIVERWTLARGVLGDVDGPMHARKLSKISAPIQAWYSTAIRDLHGLSGTPDSPLQGVDAFCKMAQCYTPEGSTLNNGIKSVFVNVFAVVDLGKADGSKTDAIADYIAMLTLSQTKEFATCRQMPSITNLLLPDCDSALKTASLSDADLAFLRGVYKAQIGDNFNLAMGDIFREMEHSSAVQALAAAAAERTGPTAPAPSAK